MTGPQDPAVHAVAPLEGDAIWFNGALQNVKLPGAFGDDALCVVEGTSTAGRATPLHTDPSNETFYVLEGELRFHVDGREYPAPAGQTITVRRGVRHAFIVVSPAARAVSRCARASRNAGTSAIAVAPKAHQYVCANAAATWASSGAPPRSASATPVLSWFSSTTASTAVPSEPPTRWMTLSIGVARGTCERLSVE